MKESVGVVGYFLDHLLLPRREMKGMRECGAMRRQLEWL